MERNFASFGDLCMMTSGGQPWALDMRQRNGNPALLGYLVNSVCHLLVDAGAFTDSFQRTAQGIAVVRNEGRLQTLAPAPLVMLALRLAKSRLIVGGQWRGDALEAVLNSCPEITRAEPGDSISPDAAGYWAGSLIKGQWMPKPERAPECIQEATYGPSR